MLTGDNIEVAEDISKKLNISYSASLLPEEKVNKISEFNYTGNKVPESRHLL